jgi:hypothetical protein
MLIDATHRGWALASIAILAAGTVAYVPYALFYPGGPAGHTWPGLIYGILGYAMMLFAGLMGARKKAPLWRIGRAKVWMRGHLWLGALSLPLILFHAGFAARGPLTFVMTVLLVVVVLSGVTGAILQHYLPARIMSEVPLETIYEQIPTVREQLRAEASTIVENLCVEPEMAALAASSLETGRVAVMDAGEEAPSADLTAEQRANLRNVYTNGILPFLRDPDSTASPLANSTKARLYFEALRRQCPPSTHEALGDIESACEEERQLTRQRRMYLILHGWLLVHVPLSVTLLVLGGIHALISIRY